MRRTAIIMCLALTAAVPRAQQSDPAQPRLVGTPAAAVLVDIVVRDRQGALVTDLEADGVEVFEDGVRQTIELFDPPRRLAPAPSAARGDPASKPGSSAATGTPPSSPSSFMNSDLRLAPRHTRQPAST